MELFIVFGYRPKGEWTLHTQSVFVGLGLFSISLFGMFALKVVNSTELYDAKLFKIKSSER